MLLAMLSIPATLVAVVMAAYVRMQPPIVVRVDAGGLASVNGDHSRPVQPLPVARGKAGEPSEFERIAFVRLFLERYLNFSPENVSRNWSDGLNMMTANLRRSTLAAFEKDNLVGRIEDEQITSVFHLRSLEPSKDDPLGFVAFGVKEVHRVRDHQESTDKLVGEFHVRLITEARSESNPGGLLIAEYRERLIEGERRDATVQETPIRKSAEP
jgi:hypothetical protein